MSDPVPPTGEFAGRYLIEGEIGRGGSAVVYRAADRTTGQAVAIKVLRHEFAQAIDAQRFLREVDLTGALRHPAIVPIVAHGEATDRPYVVLPFMEGGTLRDRLQRERQLPVDHAVEVATQVAAALTHAHGHKVIHRDVKPENILFSGGRAYLADFGIARALERAMGETTTTTGVVRGTPAYMSPEQAAGEKVLDARTDVYSLGCVVYEMLAGMPAFSGPTQQSVMAQRMTHGPRPLMVYRPSVPVALQRVVERALAPAAADRWQTAGEFAEALVASSREVASDSAPAARTGVARRLALRTIGLVAVAAAAWFGVRPLLPSADRAADAHGTVIAVVPFAASSPGDSTWQSGLLDVLARGFDGVGPLRAVPPSVVYSAWRARAADTVSAAEFARRVGAGVVLFGVLGHSGADSLRLTATLFDVVANRTLTEITVIDDESHFLRLTDSLTTRALARLAADRPIAAVRGGSFSATSMPALKAFLRGEQLLRRRQGGYALAESAYTTAVREDRNFALGWHRMRTVRRGMYGENDDSSFIFAMRAGRLNRGLSGRDSLLIRADSLNAALPRQASLVVNVASLAMLRERFRVLEQAARLYPDDPEILEELGEARHHYGDRVGATPEQALQAFEQAVAADSNYLGAYFHTIELGVGLRGPAAALALVRAARRRDSTALAYPLAETVLAARLRDPAGPVALPATRDVREIRSAAVLLLRWEDPARISEQLFRAVLARQPAAAVAPLRTSTEAFLVFDLMYHGRVGEARALATPQMLDASPHLVWQIGRLDPAESARTDSIVLRWLRDGSPDQTLVAAVWFAARRNGALLNALQRRVAAEASHASDSAAQADLHYLREVAVFAGALAGARNRRDSLSALTLVARQPDSLCTWRCQPVRELRTDLAIALGDNATALRSLDAHPPSASRRHVAELWWHVARVRARDQNARVQSLALLERAWATADAAPRSILQTLRRAEANRSR